MKYETFKRGDIYYFYNEKNKRISTGCRNRDELKIFLKNYKEEHTNLSWDKFRDYILDYLSTNGYCDKTVDTYYRVFKYMTSIFKKLPLELEALDFETYKSERRKHVSSTTVNIELSKIQAMFNILNKLGIKESRTNIQKVFQPKSQPLSIKTEEVELIIGNCPPVVKEFVVLAVNTGLRLRELTSLTPDNINGDFLEVKTTATFKTKCDKFRRVPLNDKAKEVLHTVLVTEYNAGLLSRRFKEVVRKLGLNDRYNFHTLRKTFATRCARSGMLVFDLMSILGHSDVKTTMIYYEVDLTNATKIMMSM